MPWGRGAGSFLRYRNEFDDKQISRACQVRLGRVSKKRPGGCGEEKEEGEDQGGGLSCQMSVGLAVLQAWAGFGTFWLRRRPGAQPPLPCPGARAAHTACREALALG